MEESIKSNIEHSKFPCISRSIFSVDLPQKEINKFKEIQKNSRSWVRGINTGNNIGKKFMVVNLLRFEVDKTSYKPQCRMVSRIVGRVVCRSCFSYLLNHLRYWVEISYVGKVWWAVVADTLFFGPHPL